MHSTDQGSTEELTQRIVKTMHCDLTEARIQVAAAELAGRKLSSPLPEMQALKDQLERLESAVAAIEARKAELAARLTSARATAALETSLFAADGALTDAAFDFMEDVVQSSEAEAKALRELRRSSIGATLGE